MKLYKKNILLGILLILLLIFSLCVLTKNTVIENYNVENDCIKQNPKVTNRYTFDNDQDVLQNCIREFKVLAADANICSSPYLTQDNNEDICIGGEYGLGKYS